MHSGCWTPLRAQGSAPASRQGSLGRPGDCPPAHQGTRTPQLFGTVARSPPPRRRLPRRSSRPSPEPRRQCPARREPQSSSHRLRTASSSPIVAAGGPHPRTRPSPPPRTRRRPASAPSRGCIPRDGSRQLHWSGTVLLQDTSVHAFAILNTPDEPTIQEASPSGPGDFSRMPPGTPRPQSTRSSGGSLGAPRPASARAPRPTIRASVVARTACRSAPNHPAPFGAPVCETWPAAWSDTSETELPPGRVRRSGP